MIQIRTIFITTETSIPLGYQGENLAREIVFPQPADLLGENWTLFHRRALDKEPYPVPLGMDARGLVWKVTSGDTANMGGGQAQLICTGGDGEVLKTLVYRTVVSKSLCVGGEVPDAVKPWYDAIIKTLEEAKKGADGGYYRLEIQQVDDDTMTVAYVPSKEDMPAVEPVTVQLPAGPQGVQGIQGPKGDHGDPGATGPAGAAGKTPVKGVDYWTEADKQELLDELEAEIAGVPGYWKASLDTGVQAINTALCAAGANKSAFLFYSDTHWNYGSQKSPTLLKYLYQHTGMTKTIFGGDIVNNEGTAYDTMAYLWDWRHQLKDLPNHHSVVGNHDDGNATNNLIPETYIYGYLLAPEETPEIVREKKGLWYYMDSPAEMTRYLCLDTAYQGATEKQLAFVKTALLSTPENWHIVAVAHIWYDVDYDRYNERPVPIKGLNADASKIIALLDAYNSRTGGYAACKGWVEFCVGGHCHQDYDGTTATGIPIILVETDSQHIRSALSYTAGTTTEASVNGIVADYDNHKIEVIRVGRGESRTVKIENHPVSYTNVLAKALAEDGVSVYNGVGYKENVRWSQSTQLELEQQGKFLTGWIPVHQSDVIRLQNITFTADDSCNILYSSAPGNTTGSCSGAKADSYVSPVWDSNGNLIQFVYNYTDGYFRLSCTGIGEPSIITINEPIE